MGKMILYLFKKRNIQEVFKTVLMGFLVDFAQISGQKVVILPINQPLKLTDEYPLFLVVAHLGSAKSGFAISSCLEKNPASPERCGIFSD
jgi:hypothetical protein